MELPTPEQQTYDDPVPALAAAIATVHDPATATDAAATTVTETAMRDHHDGYGRDTVAAAVQEELPYALWPRLFDDAVPDVERPTDGTRLDEALTYARGMYERGETPVPADETVGVPAGAAYHRRERGTQHAAYRTAERLVDEIMDDLTVQRMGGVCTVCYQE